MGRAKLENAVCDPDEDRCLNDEKGDGCVEYERRNW